MALESWARDVPCPTQKGGIQGIQPEFLEQVSGRDVVTSGVSYRNAAHGAAEAVVEIA